MKLPRALLLALACALAPAVAAAPLTEAEKQLLQSAISADDAMAFGKAGDASALQRIVALGDANLVQSFGTGLAQARSGPMPAAIEAVVVKHFDDARVGEALRRISPRYQTRALFDRYYARAQAAYQSNDPVFEQILRTDQPGIEEALLRIAPKFPVKAGEVNPVILFLAQRMHPAAVPGLLAALESSFTEKRTHSHVLSLLLGYESPEVWRKAGDELERLKRDGRIPEAGYAMSRTRIDPMLADPQGYLARKRGANTMAAFQKRRQELPGVPESLRAEPRRYIEAVAAHLESLEAIAAEHRSEGVDYVIAGEYATLGVFTRFAARDVPLAVRYLEKAAKGRSSLGQFALADTYQMELRDKPNALRAYQLALDTALDTGRTPSPFGGAGHSLNAFWRAWFAAEIGYLRTGKPFTARVPELAITGYWDVMSLWRGAALPAVPGWPVIRRPARVQTSAPGYSGFAINPRGSRAEWPEIVEMYAAANTSDMPAKLAALPPSHLVLMVALRHISVLADPAAILQEMARHDPSGFWTTVALGTVAFHESTGRDGALADGVADALPGMAAPGAPNALALAAQRHLKSRELRVVEKK